MLIYFLFSRNKNLFNFILILVVIVGLSLVFYFVEDEPVLISDSIEISDQFTFENEVIIRSISLKDDGYVVIHHKEDDDKIGTIIGNSSILKAGSYKNLVISVKEIDDSKEHELMAMVHYDNGDGILSFVDDTPTNKEDLLILMRPFTLTNLNFK